jgi:hypothetical protein
MEGKIDGPPKNKLSPPRLCGNSGKPIGSFDAIVDTPAPVGLSTLLGSQRAAKTAVVNYQKRTSFTAFALKDMGFIST